MLNPSSHSPLPEGEGDRTITSVDSAAERWRTALTNQTGQSMDQFLPDRGTPRRTETLRALIAIALMMAWLRRATFTPFVAYRIVLGAVLLWMIYQPSWLTP